MAFFSKKAETHTNAPAHWPKVTFEQFDNLGVNLISLLAALAPAMKPPKASMALMESFVYEDGILEVPIVVDEGGRKTGVFLYGPNDKNAGAKYSAVRSLLRARENTGAVYYGPESLTPAPPAKVLRPIDTPLFSRPKEPKANARYSLWWATPDDPRFTDSPDRAMIDRWFERINGYGFLMFTAFVNDLKLADEKSQKQVYALPDQPLLLQLTGPGRTDVMLYTSEADGLFLAFDEATTSTKRRQVMLRLLADFVGPYRAAIDALSKIPARASERGLETWTRIRDEALAKESGGETSLSLHSSTVTDGRIIRSPRASSGTERASALAIPGDDVTGFGLDLAERVGERLKAKAITQSSQEKLAGPNVFPVIAARVGGKVYERSLPYENPDVAMASAARALDEWPQADLIAVLVDAAIRENGQRVDILSVQVQQAGAPSAADAFQRYKTSDRGTIELIGRPTVAPRPSFAAPASAAIEGPAAPDAALMQLIREAADGIAKRESLSKAHADPFAVVTSPHALINVADGPGTITVFAMQGPLTAASTCARVLKDEKWARAVSVAYVFDDLIVIDSVPDRRMRICVCRRGDPATALVDWRYEGIETAGGFRWIGEPEFKRWGPPLL